MIRACHISATPNWRYESANWGDKALVYAVQEVFEKHLCDIEWSDMGCRKIYNESNIDFINEHDCLVVGGGGLILPDTFKNTVSGWQWGLHEDLIRKINIPIIVYAIGWNLFDGQSNNDEILQPNLTTLAKQATFISLRHGSDVQKYNDYTSLDNAVLNFCPTIIMDTFSRKYTGNIGFSIAGDRPERRYKDQSVVWENLLSVIKQAGLGGYNPIIVNHMELDSGFGDFARARGVKIDTVNMYNMSVQEGIHFYNSLEYMFATRGHSQMIPMGLGVKTASLISHPKLLNFLNDIDATETAIDINDEGLVEKSIAVLDVLDTFDFRGKRKIVEENISANMKTIKSMLVRGG